LRISGIFGAQRTAHISCAVELTRSRPAEDEPLYPFAGGACSSVWLLCNKSACRVKATIPSTLKLITDDYLRFFIRRVSFPPRTGRELCAVSGTDFRL